MYCYADIDENGIFNIGVTNPVIWIQNPTPDQAETHLYDFGEGPHQNMRFTVVELFNINLLDSYIPCIHVNIFTLNPILGIRMSACHKLGEIINCPEGNHTIVHV